MLIPRLQWTLGADGVYRGPSSQPRPDVPEGTVLFETDTGIAFKLTAGEWVQLTVGVTYGSPARYTPRIGYLEFDPQAAPPAHTEGRVFYDGPGKTLAAHSADPAKPKEMKGK